MQGCIDALAAKEQTQVLVNLGMIYHKGQWVSYWDAWLQWMESKGWRRFGWYVWDQGPGLPGDWNGRFAPAHEFVFHFNKVARRPKKTKKAKKLKKRK
jgi:DNA modification methylase